MSLQYYRNYVIERFLAEFPFLRFREFVVNTSFMFMSVFRIVVFLFVFFSILSCTSSVYPDRKSEISDYYGPILRKYQFQNASLLSEASRQQLQLNDEPNVQYVLFKKYYRNFISDSSKHLKERLYIVGKRHSKIEPTFQTQKESFDLLLLVERSLNKRNVSQYTSDEPPELLQFSLHKLLYNNNAGQTENIRNQKNPFIMKNFVLSVQDFSGDGLDDFFFVFQQSRNRSGYYLYSFEGTELQAILKPWERFSEQEHQSGISKYYSPFMREISADIYPAFIAEIELDFHYKITIDLSLLGDDLIRNKVYDPQGNILSKRGIPHLDFNPILIPMYYRSGQYMLRSIQQVRNRYGQIGILVCNWIFQKNTSPTVSSPISPIGRWIPDESSLEFLKKPRI